MYIHAGMVKDVIRTVFPDFNKRRVEVETATKFSPYGNFWSDGYRNYYGIVQLETMKGSVLPSDNPLRHIDDVEREIPPGFVVVKRTFSGTREYATIICHPSNMQINLEAPTEELSQNELTVLYFTRCRKACYGGISNYRFYAHLEMGGKMTPNEWEETKQGLIRKKLLMKNGALTIPGRNRAKNLDWCYKTKSVQDGVTV